MGCEPIPTDGYGDILYVEFIDGKPHSVVTTKGTYDFDWCERDQDLLYHKSGSGHRSRYSQDLSEWCDPEGKSFWAADCVELRIKREWDRDAQKYQVDEIATPELLAKYKLVRLDSIEDPFDDATEAYGGIEYCSICQDKFPDDSTCRHVWWGDEGQTGPGSDEGIKHLKDVFLRFCAIAGITRRLRKGLVPFGLRTDSLHALGGFGPSFVNLYVNDKHLGDIGEKFNQYDSTLSDAASLLFAMDAKTTEANELVKQWLDEAVAIQDKRRASYERSYVVTDDYRYATEEKYATDRYHKYLDQEWVGDDVTGTVFATDKQKHASRMSWGEASKLAKQLNGEGFRKDYFVRHLRKNRKQS